MKKNNTVKKITLCAMYAVILFLQEQVLSFIPNVQFSFLIVVTLGATVGLKWGTIIVIIHVIADNLLWGSFVPYVVIPMFMGWEVTLFFGYLTRNSKTFVVILFGVLASLIYCWLFIPFNVIFLHVKLLPYVLADIPFEIILVLSTIFTLLWLYQPLKKLITNQWQATINNDNNQINDDNNDDEQIKKDDNMDEILP